MNIVITGASSGIGRALAATFALHGHSVLAVARRESRLRELQQEMVEKKATPLAWLAVDLTAPHAPQIVLDESLRIFGKVHGLINNAGMSPYQKFRQISHVHLLQTIALNVTALTELCHVYVPHMLSHGEPSHLVNVASVGGYAPLPRFTVYTGSKHYIRIFTNCLHSECRGTNIQVSGLYPGGTLSEFPALAGQKVRAFARRTMLTPEQVAHKAYPAILKGRRVIILGAMEQLAVLIGKVLPFPLASALMRFTYYTSVIPVPPTYP